MPPAKLAARMRGTARYWLGAFGVGLLVWAAMAFGLAAFLALTRESQQGHPLYLLPLLILPFALAHVVITSVIAALVQIWRRIPYLWLIPLYAAEFVLYLLA